MNKHFFKAVLLSLSLLFALVGQVDAARLGGEEVLVGHLAHRCKDRLHQYKNQLNKPNLRLQRHKLRHQAALVGWVEFWVV